MKRNKLGFTVGAALALVMMTSLITGASASSNVGGNIGHNWHQVASPNVGYGDNALNSVYAVNNNVIWAVGYYLNKYGQAQTLIEQGLLTDSAIGDTYTWSAFASPNPGTDNYLNSVSYARNSSAPGGADAVWAVGYSVSINTTSANPYDQALIVKYNPISDRWTNASPPITNYSRVLNSVAGSAANDYLAVGYYYNPTLKLNQTLTMRWNGKEWSVVASPNFGKYNNYLTSVSVQDKNTAWAVGYYVDNFQVQHSLLLIWNGTTWKDATSWLPAYAGSNSLSGVSFHSGTGSAWLVGYDSFKAAPIAFYQYKGKWAVNPPTAGQLTGVDFISFTGAWTVGSKVSSATNTSDLAYYWDGQSWVDNSPLTTSPQRQGLQSVSGLSETNVWAVGWSMVNGHYVTQVQHYN